MNAFCQPTILGPALNIFWRNGPESFLLWTYNPVSNLYTAANPGLLAGRASVVAGPTTVFSIQGTPVLQGGPDGSVQSAAVQEYGGTGGSAGSPQLQFFIGNTRVAALTAAVLKVKSITEAAPAPGGNVFQIYANGALAATLAANGLIANEVEEGL